MQDAENPILHGKWQMANGKWQMEYCENAGGFGIYHLRSHIQAAHSSLLATS
jgi:hypothetical protein